MTRTEAMRKTHAAASALLPHHRELGRRLQQFLGSRAVKRIPVTGIQLLEALVDQLLAEAAKGSAP